MQNVDSNKKEENRSGNNRINNRNNRNHNNRRQENRGQNKQENKELNKEQNKQENKQKAAPFNKPGKPKPPRRDKFPKYNRKVMPGETIEDITKDIQRIEKEIELEIEEISNQVL